MTTAPDGREPPGSEGQDGAGKAAPSAPVGDAERDYDAPVRDTDSGWLGRLFLPLAVLAALVNLWANMFATLSDLWLGGLHFASFALLCALRYPIWRSERPFWRRTALVLDLALAVILPAATIILIEQENAIYDRGVHLSLPDWILAAITIFGAIELTRRVSGLIIPVIVIVALAYVGWWGELIGGVFKFAGLSWETLVFRSIFSDEGMFGSIGRISATYVFMFILFGAFLVRSGAGEFIVDLARCVAGRFVGGPGFVAVLASGLTGTISGSAVANTVSTGVITIPLMKRSGFPSRFAAGVEAAASTGGQLMPPIMGAGAFVMASYTQIPYLEIVAVSVLPAILYFLSVAFFVRIRAKREGLSVLDEDVPRLLDVLKRGGPSFLLPIAVLIGMLMANYTPTFAAGAAIAVVIVASWLSPNRMGPVAVVEALALGARNMILTAVLLITIGLLVNVIAMTGIGNTFSLMIAGWADGNLLIALVLIALASLVLGMGLPVTAAYIVLATLSAPALRGLIENMYLVDMIAAGTVPEAARAVFMLADPNALQTLAAPMDPEAAAALVANTPQEVLNLASEQALDPSILTLSLLSAHMIIFWLSQDSNVTPPVCLTAFAAAAIARSHPMATGFAAWKIAKGLYLMPVLFAYTPFLAPFSLHSLEIFFFAMVGLYALAAAFEGHAERPLSLPGRAICALAGVVLVWPSDLRVNLAGLVIFLALMMAKRFIPGKHA
ncbi:TRAP transporter permease [Marinibaculum pumilum]|uniref:TRAP transporter permease n=1 Tax=Marinibaculum pumilum TaxID=1766165 RepID=A0ABV7KU31_9PROT